MNKNEICPCKNEDKVYRSNKTYTHKNFGSGYTITFRNPSDDWCELYKILYNGVIDYVGDFFYDLIEDRK